MLNPTDAAQANNSHTSTLRPMGFGEILDTTFSLYRKHFPLFLGIVAVDFCGTLVVYFLARFLPDFPLNGLLRALVGMPFGLVSMGGVIVATTTIYLGKRLRSFDALQQVWQRFWQMLVCHLPWNLAFGIPRIGISVLFFAILSPTNIRLTTPILFTIILLVFMPFSIHLPIDLGDIIYGSIFSVMVLGQMWGRFIPSVLAPFAIYFAVRWLFTTVVILIERPPIQRAFARSSELTHGQWWRTWGTFISLSVLSFAIQRIVVLTIGFILMLTKMIGETTSMDLLKWIVRYGFENTNPLFYTILWWINRIIGSFTFPIWIIGITLLYFDLRIRKEGFDLEMQVNSTAATPT